MAIFKCAENSPNHEAWKRLDPLEQKMRLEKGQEALAQWTEKYQSKIIYNGPLDERTKVVDQQGIRDIPSQIGALVILKENSLDDAAKIFLDHPHFVYFPGDAIDVIECKSRHNLEELKIIT